MLSISAAFDAGNIEVVDSSSPQDIQLKIRAEPFTHGTDEQAHMQWCAVLRYSLFTCSGALWCATHYSHYSHAVVRCDATHYLHAVVRCAALLTIRMQWCATHYSHAVVSRSTVPLCLLAQRRTASTASPQSPHLQRCSDSKALIAVVCWSRFYFRASNAKGVRCVYNITNAGESSYAEDFEG